MLRSSGGNQRDFIGLGPTLITLAKISVKRYLIEDQ